MAKVKCYNCDGAGRMYKKMGSMLDCCPVCKGDRELEIKPTDCRVCGKNLGLNNDDAGSDKEVYRLCDKHLNSENIDGRV
jgi:hypothetical protein